MVAEVLTAASPTTPFRSLSKSMKNSLILILSFATCAWRFFSTSSSMFLKAPCCYWALGWKELTTEMAIRNNCQYYNQKEWVLPIEIGLVGNLLLTEFTKGLATAADIFACFK